MKIEQYSIGLEHPPFVIAEAGSNHDGSLSIAKEYVRASAEAGAHAVKFQMFTQEGLVNPEVPDGKGGWMPHPAWDLVKTLSLPPEWLEPLVEECEKRKILFTCTPFDEGAVDALDRVGIKFYKVASGELTHALFLQKVGSKGKPVVMSTGMGDIPETKMALGWLKGCPVSLLHCVSNYPPKDEDMGIRALTALGREFPGIPLGFSDHTPGSALCAAAVALGARVFEKHVTFDRTLKGVDHDFAITFPELKTLVEDVKRVFYSLGNDEKIPMKSEEGMRVNARRGIYAARDLRAGEVLHPDMVRIVRPCHEGSASDVLEMLGRPLPKAVPAHRPLPPKGEWR